MRGNACGGGTFRNNNVEALGCFPSFIGISTSLHADLVGAMLAIELAHKKGWKFLWLESDFQLVNLAFKHEAIVP